MSMRRLLAVLAHPDDESFGIGGTLARYAREGVAVHIAIATDGVAGSVADGFEAAKTDLVNVRQRELEAAVAELGGRLHTLGFRDSGYIGDPANQHPEAFINLDTDVAVRAVVALIRTIRPQVVITHDEMGGYFHPDHIHCWKVTTAAYHAAGDATRYPGIGLRPYRPQRLYYTAFPNTMVRLMTFLMRLRRQDPTQVGRNKDIDLTRLGVAPRHLHASIDYRDTWDIKRAASAHHASQGGQGGPRRDLPDWIQRRYLAKEYFIQADPPGRDGRRVHDLFDGVRVDTAVADEPLHGISES